jgi:hypothetical protein
VTRTRLFPWPLLLFGACQFPALPDITDAPPDNEPPETTIDSSPAAVDRATASSFTFSASEDATFICSLDSAGFAPCSSPYTRTVGSGQHAFQVVAVDLAGNADPSPASFTWVVDTAPPTTSITSAPAAVDNSTTVSFEFAANEQSTFECALDTQAFVACTSPHMIVGLQDGIRTFRVRATDIAGNVELSPPVHTWTIDSSTPDTQIDSGPSGTTGSQTATFSFSSPDAGNGATFTCEIDGGGFTSCSSPVTFNSLLEGPHTFRVRVRDVVGNVDPTPASRTWTIDLTGPETMIVTGPSGSVAATSATFMFSSNETATFECRLDAAGYVGCPANHSLAGLSEGVHTLDVRAVDLQGNPDTTPAQRSWTVDTVDPIVTITQPAEGSTTGTPVAVQFSLSEPATTTCRVDGSAFQACASGSSYAFMTGSHTIDVRAVDLAGNTGTSSRTWNVDFTSPETSIASGPSGTVSDTSASFVFESPDSTATFECSLDAASFVACPASHTVVGLTDGMHTMRVRAVDPVGNRDGSPAIRTWTVDTVAPDTQIFSSPSSLERVRLATFDFGASETGSTFQCSLDGGAYVPCADPYSTSVGNGSHQLSVRAVDAAGNPDASPASASWTVDLPNLVFVTSTVLTGNLGGLAGADTVCQARAQAAGLYGTYRAWLSTSTVNASSRLGSASGWHRTDGQPFANSLSDITSGKILHPISRDEFGTEVTSGSVMTATNAAGVRDTATGTCLDWTTNQTVPQNWATVGAPSGTSTRFTQFVSYDGQSSFVTACDFGRLYCFGIDYTTSATVPTPTSRQVFLTDGTWTPGGGIAAADTVCAQEAQAAGLVGSFKAVLPTQSEGANSRFNASGLAWSRPDGPLVASSASAFFSSSTLLSSPNVSAAGRYVQAIGGGDEFWSGPWTIQGTQTCSDWTSSSSAQTGSTGRAADIVSATLQQSPSSPCNRALRLLCLEE